MTDPGNPENPQGENNSKSNNGKGSFGWYTPPSGEPRKLNLGDDQPHQDQTPATDQEALFRSAAIKCAEMEEELAELMNNTSVEDFERRYGKYLKETTEFLLQKHKDGYLSMRTKENMIGLNGEPTPVMFGTGIKKANSDLNQPNVMIGPLRVSLHTDKPTSNAYKEAVERREYLRDGELYTEYYFSRDGGYYKISHFKNYFNTDPDRKNLLWGKDTADPEVWKKENSTMPYESEMTADDFELAGQALQMLISRLKPQDQK